MRKTVFFNYIPHEKTKFIRYKKWFEVYESQIKNLYSIFKENILSSSTSVEIDFEKEEEKIFRAFIRFLWETSSKHVFPFEMIEEESI